MTCYDVTMKLALEIDVPDSISLHATMRDAAERVGRIITACKAFDVSAPTTVRLPVDVYYEASVTCARPAHGPESLIEEMLALVPDLREIKVDRHVEQQRPGSDGISLRR